MSRGVRGLFDCLLPERLESPPGMPESTLTKQCTVLHALVPSKFLILHRHLIQLDQHVNDPLQSYCRLVAVRRLDFVQQRLAPSDTRFNLDASLCSSSICTKSARVETACETQRRCPSLERRRVL